jgi:hypothetical protein
MLNLPPPPSQPLPSKQTLKELADYYRQLIEYYQKAAAQAEEKLFYVEALLNPIQIFDAEASAEGYLALSAVESYNSDSESDVGVENLDQENLILQIVEILEANRGKILQIDYLIWEIFGNQDEKVQLALKSEVGKILKLGEQDGFWDAVPDSPGCWTIDLNDFPDFKKQTQASLSNGKKNNTRSKQAHPTGLPNSQILEQFDTLHSAIFECLQIHYPGMMDVSIVLQWLYPDGLSPSQEKIVSPIVTKTLSKGCGKGWQYVGKGLYVWDIDA